MAYRRFGIAPRLITGLFALVLLTVLAVAVALSGFTRFRTGFDHIADSQFSELVLVAKLAQMAQAISVTAPALVVSTELFELDRASHHIGDLFKQVDTMLESLAKIGVSTATMPQLTGFRQQLHDTLSRLNRLVSDRIATERKLREGLRRAETLLRDVRSAELGMVTAGSQATAGTAVGDVPAPVLGWTVALDEASSALLLATIAVQPGELRRQQAMFDAGITRARQAQAALPVEFASRAGAMTAELGAIATGSSGIFAGRAAQQEILREIQGSLNHSKIISTQFIAAAANLFVEMQTNIEAERGAFVVALDRDAVVLVVACGVAILATFGIFLFLRHGVIRRLLALRHCMLAHAAGERPQIPDRGADELSDMADALRFFIAEIDQRESELRTAKDRAEEALVDLKSAQARLIQAEKMTALSGLVAGVAHEMNTPLGNILTAVSLLADETTAMRSQFDQNALRRSDMARFLVVSDNTSRIIQSATHRATSLIQTFKQVAVSSSGEGRRRITLADHLSAIVTTIRSSLRPHEIAINCPAEIEIISDPGALVQIITQLLLNAVMHAFSEAQAGLIAVTVVQNQSDLVCIMVRDNGRGIASENLGRVFEPFFTTRRNDGGTGLGLHIVYNTVTQQLQGQITVTSAPGQGTEFVMVLPSGAAAMETVDP